MSSKPPAHQDTQDDGKQLQVTTSIHPITEQGNQDDGQHLKHSTDNPSIAQPSIHTASQHPGTTNMAPTDSPATPTSISPLGRPPPSSKHYYLKEMWPGQPLCHLCRKEYKKTNRAIRALPCGDVFHRACLDHLLGRKDGRCPSCEDPIPDDWYLPHVYDPAKPLGEPCLCHPVSRTGGVKTGDSSMTIRGTPPTSPGNLETRRFCERFGETVMRCIPGRKPRKSYVGYKTETGQIRYVEKETDGALSDARPGDVDEGSNHRVSC